jgi:dienelactone hydrolase
MATPVLTHHELPGALGPIFVDVRTATRDVPQPAVLVVHGFKGFKDFALLAPMAERLARAGFTAVNLSVSGAGVNTHGEFVHLDRFARNSYTREMDDIELVIDAITSGALDVVPPPSVGMIGHSRGGGVALCVARETPAVAALVTWAAISTIVRYTPAEVALWRRLGTIETQNTRTGQMLPMNFEIVEDALAHADRFDIGHAAATFDRPWLLIHGLADETVPVGEGRALAALATSDNVESLFLPGATHSFGGKHPWAGATRETDALFDATVRFLSRHLG